MGKDDGRGAKYRAMKDFMDTENAKLLAQGLEGEKLPTVFRAEDDQLQVCFELKHFPPMQLWFGPEEVLLDGELVYNMVNDDMFDGHGVDGYESLTTVVKRIEWLPPGPGPEQFRIELETPDDDD